MSASQKSDGSPSASLTLIVTMEENFEITNAKNLRIWMKHYPLFVLFLLWIFPKMLFCPSGSMRVIGCLPENSTNCDINVIRSPVNVSSTVSINLNRGHNGADFRCEAQMDLGPEGPQHPLNMMSIPFNIPVHCKIPFTFAAQQPRLRWCSKMKWWWTFYHIIPVS